MATVLIVGASRGIGLELARHYGADGARVIASHRRPEDAAALRARGRWRSTCSRLRHRKCSVANSKARRSTSRS